MRLFLYFIKQDTVCINLDAFPNLSFIFSERLHLQDKTRKQDLTLILACALVDLQHRMWLGFFRFPNAIQRSPKLVYREALN